MILEKNGTRTLSLMELVAYTAKKTIRENNLNKMEGKK